MVDGSMYKEVVQDGEIGVKREMCGDSGSS